MKIATLVVSSAARSPDRKPTVPTADARTPHGPKESLEVHGSLLRSKSGSTKHRASRSGDHESRIATQLPDLRSPSRIAHMYAPVCVCVKNLAYMCEYVHIYICTYTQTTLHPEARATSILALEVEVSSYA